MPWKIVSNHPSCPKSRPFGVVKETDDELEGCHASQAAAQKQIAALYAQESKMDFPRDDLIRMVELPAADVAFRAADGGDDGIGTLVGYAAVFNSPTVIDSWEGNFRESIAPGAFAASLNKDGDRVKVLFNHGMDPSIGNKPLGKPRKMEERKKGLYVEVPLDETSYNRDLVASLKSGALDGMSIRFSVVREEWKDAEAPELPDRTIKQVRLFEFGPVTFPAYEASTAGIRGREAYKAWRTVHPNFAPDVANPGTSEATADTSPLRHLSAEQRAAVADLRNRLEYLRSHINGKDT